MPGISLVGAPHPPQLKLESSAYNQGSALDKKGWEKMHDSEEKDDSQ